jgi:hypothetical protein
MPGMLQSAEAIAARQTARLRKWSVAKGSLQRVVYGEDIHAIRTL